MEFGNEVDLRQNWNRAKLAVLASLALAAFVALLALTLVSPAESPVGTRVAQAGELQNGTAYCGNRYGGVRLQTYGYGSVVLDPGPRRTWSRTSNFKVRYYYGYSGKVHWSASTSTFFTGGTYSVCKPYA